MLRILRTAVAAVCLTVAVLTASSASAEIRLGILPRLGAVELFTMFSPLADYLTAATGERVRIVIPKDFDAFKKAFTTGHLDIGFSNSLVYVQLAKRAHAEPLAISVERGTGAKFRGIIIARKDSGIKTVKDLRGKRLVFVDRDSAAGYVFQMRHLKLAGLDVSKDFDILPFAKKHDNVVAAVFNGAADAGGIRENDLAKMKKSVDLSQLRIVAYTEFFPNWPVFAAPGFRKDKREKVKAALLKLNPHSSRSAAVVGAARLTGFEPVSDRDYDGVRRAAALVGAL